MIDIALLRDDTTKDEVKRNLATRGVAPSVIDELAKIDERWRTASARLDEARRQKNEASEKITSAPESKRGDLIHKMKIVDKQEKGLQEQIESLSTERDTIWKSLPNLAAPDVPEGGAGDFTVLKDSKVQPSVLKKRDRNYLTIAHAYVDIERAGKAAGSRFVYIKGHLARLEIAMISFAFDALLKQGFTPVIPPVLLKPKAMAGMGYLEHGGDEIYKTQDETYLVGTSEQSLGPMHMDEVLEEELLPIRYVAFSSCFRREAGSHGKDVHGILRLHQFEKVEMFSFAHPEQSEQEHQFLLAQQEHIMEALELPYRVITLASRDLGTPSSKTFDIETWFPSENRYRETHSTSNTTDYQSRRLHIRFHSKNGTKLVHMLNGTAIAMPRILIPFIERHAQDDGSISIPKAILPYLPFHSIPPAESTA